MQLEKPTPWQLMTKSSALLNWILGGIFSLFFLYPFITLVKGASISQETVLSQEVIFLISFFLIPVVYFLTSFRLPTIIAIFDLQEGNFLLEKRWFLGKKIVRYPIAKMKKVHVIQKGRFGKAKLYYKIKVELQSGELLPLSASNYREKNSLQMIANELDEFLNLKES